MSKVYEDSISKSIPPNCHIQIMYQSSEAPGKYIRFQTVANIKDCSFEINFGKKLVSLDPVVVEKLR